MRIVITGAAGFIGSHLLRRLQSLGHADLVALTRDSNSADFDAAMATADFVYHLAGVNRPKDPAEFDVGNTGLTQALLARLLAAGRGARVALSSSTQAAADNPYGRSKLGAEGSLLRYGRDSGAPVYLFRLTNVFGPGARPFYNSAVATFCHQAANGQKPTLHDPAAPLRLVYVDDVIDSLVAVLDRAHASAGPVDVSPVYQTTVGDVAQMAQDFAQAHREGLQPDADGGLRLALHETLRPHLQAARAAGPAS